ncbi:MAG TPA: poly-gamma-glutamate biosynthesis protein PgsC/CapC, partial [Polyangia bacterium]
MFHLFPHGLDATLLIPVLLGVLVNAAFTEFFGWDFVGLVVPGYLCSVIMLQPIVAAVVLVEAVVTWSLARAVDGVATRAGAIYPVFGRDRFFLILVVSVLVRSIIEGLAMPPALAMLRGPWPSIARHEPDLFGIGLVLVPLLANRLWNPGLRSGLFQLTVETAGVRLLLLGLQVFTNFSVAGFELSFDRLALGFLTAPGAQIVLICTAALASHFNRRFGWDSHGILVPALLGLVVMA